ncbi:hypothetical protein ALC62_02228 [Cyphomyrmex costatus]|uniref:Uncharacterized protein n=1 Tax=Cyphomyrmex costatus TaxID=456900 RepID=A0A195D1Q3_9HYME|nr:hypothetical protein ALC62_02228 [Cyphomyrmex costatus]
MGQLWQHDNSHDSSIREKGDERRKETVEENLPRGKGRTLRLYLLNIFYNITYILLLSLYLIFVYHANVKLEQYFINIQKVTVPIAFFIDFFLRKQKKEFYIFFTIKLQFKKVAPFFWTRARKTTRSSLARDTFQLATTIMLAGIFEGNNVREKSLAIGNSVARILHFVAWNYATHVLLLSLGFAEPGANSSHVRARITNATRFAANFPEHERQHALFSIDCETDCDSLRTHSDVSVFSERSDDEGDKVKWRGFLGNGREGLVVFTITDNLSLSYFFFLFLYLIFFSFAKNTSSSIMTRREQAFLRSLT